MPRRFELIVEAFDACSKNHDTRMDSGDGCEVCPRKYREKCIKIYDLSVLRATNARIKVPFRYGWSKVRTAIRLYKAGHEPSWIASRLRSRCDVFVMTRTIQAWVAYCNRTPRYTK